MYVHVKQTNNKLFGAFLKLLSEFSVVLFLVHSVFEWLARRKGTGYDSDERDSYPVAPEKDLSRMDSRTRTNNISSQVFIIRRAWKLVSLGVKPRNQFPRK